MIFFHRSLLVLACTILFGPLVSASTSAEPTRSRPSLSKKVETHLGGQPCPDGKTFGGAQTIEFDVLLVHVSAGQSSVISDVSVIAPSLCPVPITVSSSSTGANGKLRQSDYQIQIQAQSVGTFLFADIAAGALEEQSATHGSRKNVALYKPSQAFAQKVLTGSYPASLELRQDQSILRIFVSAKIINALPIQEHSDVE